MHEPKKIVIFAGAGFSVPVGIPAMNSFVDVLRDKHLTPKEVRQFDAIMKDCAARASLIDANVRNLEILASFVSMVRFSSPDYRFGHDDDSLSAAEAEEFLRDIVSRVAGIDLDSSKLNGCRQLMEKVASWDDIRFTLITTNYDLHFELANCHPISSRHRGSGVRYALPPKVQINNNELNDLYSSKAKMIASDNESDQNQPLLLKLHGSVNWQLNGDDMKVHAEIEALPAFQGDNSSKDFAYGHKGSSFVPKPLSWKKPDQQITPDLVLPTVLKPAANFVMELQWRLAAKALKTADQVWFIGYSFPESDSYMRYFLASCLADNAHIRQIAIIDPDRTVYYERALKVFSDARLWAIMNMYPHKWNASLSWDSVLHSNPLAIFANSNHLQTSEKHTRALKAHQGEYYVDANENAPSNPRGRGRSTNELRLR